MADEDSFAVLIDRLRLGEDDAVQEVFQRYVGRLLNLTRDQIDGRLAHKVDAEDVVQSAYKSFILRHQEGKLHVGNRKSLWNLLTLITMRKCAQRIAYLRGTPRHPPRSNRIRNGQPGGTVAAGPRPRAVARRSRHLGRDSPRAIQIGRSPRAPHLRNEFARLLRYGDQRTIGKSRALRSPLTRAHSPPARTNADSGVSWRRESRNCLQS